METGVSVIIWTILLLTTTSELNSESTASPPALTPGLTANDPVSVAIDVTSKNNDVEVLSDSVHPSEFPLNNETSHTAVSAVPLPSEPSTRMQETDPSSLPDSTYTPVLRHTESVEASTDTSPSVISLGSTSTTPGSMVSVMAFSASSMGRDVHQTSSPSTISASEAVPTASSVPSSSPASTLTALTDKPKATGPVPLENPHQEGAPELDVGDEDADKVPHASPWDPLLAALVSVFIVSTALVSVMLFLRFRQQSEHPEFHRLQDLPMDDLLEDTPLSRYSY